MNADMKKGLAGGAGGITGILLFIWLLGKAFSGGGVTPEEIKAQAEKAVQEGQKKTADEAALLKTRAEQLEAMKEIIEKNAAEKVLAVSKKKEDDARKAEEDAKAQQKLLQKMLDERDAKMALETKTRAAEKAKEAEEFDRKLKEAVKALLPQMTPSSPPPTPKKSSAEKKTISVVSYESMEVDFANKIRHLYNKFDQEGRADYAVNKGSSRLSERALERRILYQKWVKYYNDVLVLAKAGVDSSELEPPSVSSVPFPGMADRISAAGVVDASWAPK